MTGAPVARELLDPAEHEPLSGGEWDPDRVRSAIEAIVADTRAAFVPGRFWSRAADDDYGQSSDLGVWIGAAGVLWALGRLGAGLGEAGLYASWRADPDAGVDADGRPALGLMWRETGVLLVSWRLEPTEEKAARLRELVAANADAPDTELFSGSPGTMLAALHLHEAGDPAAGAIWRACAEVLSDRLYADPEHGCRLWIQHRHGRLIRSLGAGHGFASNARSLLRGRALLASDRVAELESAAVRTTTRFALRDGELVNWPTAADAYWAERFLTRLQWCHGAPGFVTSLADVDGDAAFGALLRGAGELVWRAGPLRKGAGLCHGTAGNGCALLALHARTGEGRWLERARAFGMHALAQVQRTGPRHSLWTGGIGVALYLRACLEGRFDGMPFIDVL